MGIVAVAGDTCTTSSVALAAAWPATDDVVVIEADPNGGDLAAWLDMPTTPSLSTVVTTLPDGSWSDLERFVRVADSGLRLIPAPVRIAEAGRAVGEAARTLVPLLAALPSTIAIVDTGRLAPSPASHPFVAAASVTVLVHRQATQSAGAAAVRLQRLEEQLDTFASAPTALVVAVVGAAPFDLGEIESYLADSVGVHSIIGLPVDELAAAVLAGRRGVSERRLARLPLVRASRDLASAVSRSLDDHTVHIPGRTP